MSREPFETMPDVMDANQPIARVETYSASFGQFLSKNRITFSIQEPRKICEKQEIL